MNKNNLEDFIGFMLANNMLDDNFGLKENDSDNTTNNSNYKVKERRKNEENRYNICNERRIR